MKRPNITYPRVIMTREVLITMLRNIYKRYNVLANFTSQATSWLRFNVNTKYSYTNSSHPNAGSDWDPDRTFFISELIKFFPTTPKVQCQWNYK